MLLFVSAFLMACQSDGNSASSEETEPQVIKFAGVNPDSHPAMRAINEVFVPMVEENSDGQLTVEVYGNGQLGGERDVMEQTQMGQVQMTYLSPIYGSIYEPINILDLPFLFKDMDHVDAVLEGELGAEILDGLEETGLKGLAFMDNGSRQITNNVKEINTIEDLKGLKIRVPEAPISIANLSALGTNTVTVAFNELYSALQQGVVDGQENAYTTIAASKLSEVQKYVAETNHMFSAFTLLTNNDWFNELTPELQKVVEEAALETASFQKEIFREEEAANKQLILDEGMILSTPDLAPFIEASEVVYEEYYSEHPEYKELIEKIRAAGN